MPPCTLPHRRKGNGEAHSPTPPITGQTCSKLAAAVVPNIDISVGCGAADWEVPTTCVLGCLAGYGPSADPTCTATDTYTPYPVTCDGAPFLDVVGFGKPRMDRVSVAQGRVNVTGKLVDTNLHCFNMPSLPQKRKGRNGYSQPQFIRVRH